MRLIHLSDLSRYNEDIDLAGVNDILMVKIYLQVCVKGNVQ